CVLSFQNLFYLNICHSFYTHQKRKILSIVLLMKNFFEADFFHNIRFVIKLEYRMLSNVSDIFFIVLLTKVVGLCSDKLVYYLFYEVSPICQKVIKFYLYDISPFLTRVR